MANAIPGQRQSGAESEWRHHRLAPDRASVERPAVDSWPPLGTTHDPNDAAKTVPAPYNAASSTGSNLGPTSKNLLQRLLADRAALETMQPDLAGTRLPADMLTTSASGLDPEISPANASLQVAHVAQARGVPPADINALLESRIAGRSFFIFGEPRVNVLDLNLALQRAYFRSD